jgi:hypothetical protein
MVISDGHACRQTYINHFWHISGLGSAGYINLPVACKKNKNENKLQCSLLVKEVHFHFNSGKGILLGDIGN